MNINATSCCENFKNTTLCCENFKNTTCCCENFKNTTLCCGNFKCVIYIICRLSKVKHFKVLSDSLTLRAKTNDYERKKRQIKVTPNSIYKMSEKEQADSLRLSVASNVKVQSKNYVKMCCQEGFIVDYNRKICVDNRDPILK